MSGDYLRETLAECGKRAEADLGRVSTWTRSVCKLQTPSIELLDTTSIMTPLRFQMHIRICQRQPPLVTLIL